MSDDIKRHIFYILLTAIILIQVFLLLFNGDNFVGGDNRHYFQIARFSFRHPKLFLDLSGNPVYTTFLAPFTLLGYNTAKAFNLIIAILTLVLTAKLSDKIFKGSSNYIIVLIAFSPVYFFLMISCFPEVLFGLFAVAAVYLFSRNKLYFSAIILSFIPFIRFEGLLLFPVFAFAYLLKRNYWPIVFLSLGTVFYTLTGLFAFGDWLWIMHKFSNPLGQSVSVSGSLFHFIKNSNFIFGVPFLVLLVLGLVYWLFQIIRDFSLKDENVVLFIIIYGSSVIYLVVNSFVIWGETGKNLEVARVIGAIIPLTALILVKGIQFLSERIKDKRYFIGIISGMTVAQVLLMFMLNDLPGKASPVAELIRKSSKYIKQADFTGKVYCFDPEIIFQLGIDPYDQTKCGLGNIDTLQPSNSMEWGDLLVWDANFGSTEKGVLLGNIEKDPYLKKMESFILPKKNVGMDDYSLRVYKKSTNKNDSSVISDNYTRTLNFDNVEDPRVIEVDGYKVWKLDSSQEYGPTIALSSDVVKRYEKLDFEVVLDYKALEPLNHDQVVLVFSAEDAGKSVHYESNDLVYSSSDWKQLKVNIKLPANAPASKILAYIWNKDRKKVLMKSLVVNVKSH